MQRGAEELDAERITTAHGGALVTTPEQTVLDLARRPRLGNADAEVPAAVAALHRRSDRDRLEQLATQQRMVTSLRRAETWAGVKS